jgi:hypothetical protein
VRFAHFGNVDQAHRKRHAYAEHAKDYLNFEVTAGRALQRTGNPLVETAGLDQSGSDLKERSGKNGRGS